MSKVIQLEKIRKKIRDEKANRYNAYTAYVHFLYQKKYKIDSKLSDLYQGYLGELKTWTEFKEALPKLKPELLHYAVVHYYFAWYRCKTQLFDTSMFQKLGFYYQFRYSKDKYRKIFYYICYPHIIKSGDKVEQYQLFNIKNKKIDTSYDDLYAYQKKREAERDAQLEKERENLKKKEIKFNFTAPGKTGPFMDIGLMLLSLSIRAD